MVEDRSRLQRRGAILLLALALAANTGAMLVTYFAFEAVVEAGLDVAAGLALVVVSLLLIALFCVGVLLLRFLAYAPLMGRKGAGATEYVDAWKVAGERLRIEGDDDDDETRTIDLDPFDDDFPEDDDRREDG